MRADVKEALGRWASHGYQPGDFLTAVLSNDLFEAAARADMTNRFDLWEICEYIYNELPSACWGSREKVEVWRLRREADRRG